MIRHPSPNHGPRRDGARPELIVLHYTAMQSAEAALDRLCDPAFEVSSHYLIGRCGTVWQLVDEEQRAWHAGAGCWGGREDVNSRSIGIELDNSGLCPFSEPLMGALEGLLPGIMDRHGIRPEGVIGHSDMAPGRKVDPGARFDWQRLARQGLSVWPEAAQPQDTADPHRFESAARRFGYHSKTPLAPFRLRFRPHANGPLDAADCAMMEDLAQRFPVDPGTADV